MTMTTDTINAQEWVGGEDGDLRWCGLTVERSDEDEVYIKGMSHPDQDREDVDLYLSRAEATRLLIALATAVSND